MFYIDLYEAQNLIKDATLVFSSEIDNLEEDDMSLGKGIFSLYRLNSGKHIVEAYLVNQKHKEYSLLISPSEVIKAFYCLNRVGDMFSYLETLYKTDYEEVTIRLPRKLMKHIKYLSNVRKETFASAFISSLDEDCLNLR